MRHICICGAFFQITHAQLPHPKNVGRVYPDWSPSFNIVYGGVEGGGGWGRKVQDIFKKVALFYDSTKKLKEIVNTTIYIIVSRTFV